MTHMEQVLEGFASAKGHKYCGRRMRIADFLLLEEEEEEREEGDEKECGVAAEIEMSSLRRQDEVVSCGFECPSPRRAISRWFRRRKEKRGVVGQTREEEERELGDGLGSLSVSGIRTKVEDGSSHTVNGKDESGQHRKENMFNLGAAGSLLYLIAASKNELNKMEDLRKEMELLLQNVKEKVRRKDSSCDPSESTESVASCLTDIKEVLSCGSQLSEQSHRTPSHLLEQHRHMQLNQSSGCECKQEPVEGIEELEAELEAELERLQLQLDAETSSKQSYQEMIKIAPKESASGSGRSTSFGDVMNPEDEATEVQGGVPPIELERRLHEVLETRQQERIKELEASLERLEHKLSEKEREISWWKDTALLLSQHVSGPSHGGLTNNETLIC
ncbi:protein POLAR LOCALIZATION DURING ASYMMETRIC DIVISION AND REDISTRIBUTION-like isoform X2 [Rhodamnia argentea]|uniref:Protein POLAR LOCALIZATION DURING ASYMMETRIC DIVISION AND REDISTRIBUTION-like isoform X2 n=1 Tax=Rhodamnia argentea TaxID=178133 RepID=A0A8B8NLT5_9MYRT|nr:protein POLAR LOCALIZATION DURING ASYMMETRIC DIVISION AND REDISTRIBUTION-like isoform X2 [Rhodamnia argentea]